MRCGANRAMRYSRYPSHQMRMLGEADVPNVRAEPTQSRLLCAFRSNTPQPVPLNQMQRKSGESLFGNTEKL